MFRRELLVFREGRWLSQSFEKSLPQNWFSSSFRIGLYIRKIIENHHVENIEMLDRSEFDRSAEFSSIGLN